MNNADKKLTLVIDQGTHATRAMAIGAHGDIAASSFCKIGLKRLGSDMTEQNAEEIIASVHTVIKTLLNHQNVKRAGIICAGIATQRSSVAAWDKRSGKPVAPVISWQDFRYANWLKKFEKHADKIKSITGLPLSAHYGASKMRWYMDKMPAIMRGVKDNTIAIGPLVSFILFNMLKKHPYVCDHSNALRTQLMDVRTLDWHPWLMALFELPNSILPEPVPVCYDFGMLKIADIPVTAVNGDQNAAVYSLGRPAKDTAIVNIGSGAFIIMPTGDRLVHEPLLLSGLSSSSHQKREYGIEGTVNGAGAAINWAADEWRVQDVMRFLPGWLAQHQDVPLFINTVGGLGSPWWEPGPKAKIIGGGGVDKKMVAVVESILFMLNANLEKIRKTGLKMQKVQISGGLSNIDGLCQRFADLVQLPVYRPADSESTARGIAFLASGRPRHWRKTGRGKVFKPQHHQGLIDRFQQLVQLLEGA